MWVHMSMRVHMAEGGVHGRQTHCCLKEWVHMGMWVPMGLLVHMGMWVQATGKHSQGQVNSHARVNSHASCELTCPVESHSAWGLTVQLSKEFKKTKNN